MTVTLDAPVHIVNVGYDSTNYYVVGNGDRRLLVDVGWPATLPRLLANLRRKDIGVRQVACLLATHYHPDHAGLAQELKTEGVRLLVLAEQVDWIPRLKAVMKPQHRYVDITLHDNLALTCERSRAFLATLGLTGEIVHTPGHSDDSVSLVLDSGEAFTGDLTSPAMIVDDQADAVMESWARLRQLGARQVFPGHGPAPRPMPPA